MCLGILIFGDKKEQLLKALWLLMSLDYWIVFDLPSHSSELRKRYTKAAVDVSRDTGRREFWELFCLVGGEK